MTGTVFIQPKKMGHFGKFCEKKFFSKRASSKFFLETLNLLFILSKNNNCQIFLLEKKNFDPKTSYIAFCEKFKIS